MQVPESVLSKDASRIMEASFLLIWSVVEMQVPVLAGFVTIVDSSHDLIS